MYVRISYAGRQQLVDLRRSSILGNRSANSYWLVARSRMSSGGQPDRPNCIGSINSSGIAGCSIPSKEPCTLMIYDQLTSRQREVFEFIRDKIDNRGYGPTVREIGEFFGIASPNGVMCHLK